MTEPTIRYAKTTDGVNIAYGEAGEGKPLIVMSPPGWSHAERSWTVFAALFQPLVSTYRVLWFDYRGTGLSDRDAVDFSMPATQRDVESVIAKSGADRLVLLAFNPSVPIAVTYATTHPDRVSHLILCDGWTSFSDYSETAAYKATSSLLELDWTLYTETFGQVIWAYSNPELGRVLGEYGRACSEPEAGRASWKAWKDYDIAALLPKVTAPTLVIHNRDNRLIPLAAGQRIAAAIPGARLQLIDDVGIYAPVPDLVKAFISETESSTTSATWLPSGIAVILFADIADSTALTERLGDALFREKARDLDTSLRTIIRERGGTPIEGKLLGDGVLSTFSSASQAIEAALECGAGGGEAGLALHLGIHAGDVIREENNVYGGAVNIAARIAGASAPGEVLVSQTVRDLARTSAGVSFEDRGRKTLRGVEGRQRLFEVRRQPGPAGGEP